MTQLTKMQALLDSPSDDDAILEFYLDNAKDIICDIRNSDVVETKFLTTQIKIAIELYNKIGAEGQITHSENGMYRAYEKGDVSATLLAQVTPMAKTPYSAVRVVT